MAFKVDYGDGNLGDVVISDGSYNKINSFARITAINGNIITIDAENAFVGDFEHFTAGNEVLIHVSATNATDTAMLGAFMTCKIELVDRNILTLDKPVFDIDLERYYVQAVTIANFKNVYLMEGAILSPPQYSPFLFIGGILAVKAWNEFSFEGGHIDLTECGIPTKYKDRLRPITYQESAARGELDSGSLAGEENFITDKILMNAGDGVCYLAAKELICDGNSRIGNINTYGKAHCRAAADTKFKPSNTINIGGSTIIIAAETIKHFDTRMFAKYRDSRLDAGKGLSRCFIATESNIAYDDKLYAADLIANPYRVVENLGVYSFDYESLDLSNLAVTENYICVQNLTLNSNTTFPPDVTIIADTITGFDKNSLRGNDNFIYCNNLA